MLGLCSIAPAVFFRWLTVPVFKRYRPQIWMAWSLQIIGAGLMTTVNENTPTANTVGFCVIYGVGAG